MADGTVCWGYPEHQHHQLIRYIGWDDNRQHLNRLTMSGFNVDHHRFAAPGPDVDDLLVWLRERWLVEIDTLGAPERPYQVDIRDSVGFGVRYASPWHSTLIEALATAALFLGAELERASR